MPDYGKKTVVELQEILKGRSLPHSGKKAELVARLNQADQSIETKPSDSTENVPASARGIGAGQTAPAAEPESAPAPEPMVTNPKISAPAVNDQDVTSLAPLQNEETDGEASVNTDSNLAAAADYSMGLSQSLYEDELKKRKARAERFGASAQDLDAETLRAAERAKKFGTVSPSVAKLDEALPMESERRGKRGRGGDSSLHDPGLRQARGDKRRFLGGGGRNGRRGEKPTGVQKAVGNAIPVFSREQDRLAAEARKKKFAAA